MELTIAEELHRTFDLASLRKEAATLRTGRQWYQAFKLQLRCDVARQKEERLYEDRYEARVETARRRLIDEAGSVTRNFKHPAFGEDRFDPDTTLRQAERDVRQRHLARLEGFERFEQQGLRAIVEQSMRENLLHGKSREAFQGAVVERRRGRTRSRE